jgi:Na+/pantothenate symporter
LFIIALISALFPSVDGAITSLTSSFCIDIMNINANEASEANKKKTRLKVHFSFALLFFIMVLVFKAINDKLIVDLILKLAGFTYGPLLGLFAFGILTQKGIRSKWVALVCIASPLLTVLLDMLASPEWYEKKLQISLGLNEFSASLFNGYKIGNELILINGILTFAGLFLISHSKTKSSINNG